MMDLSTEFIKKIISWLDIGGLLGLLTSFAGNYSGMYRRRYKNYLSKVVCREVVSLKTIRSISGLNDWQFETVFVRIDLEPRSDRDAQEGLIPSTQNTGIDTQTKHSLIQYVLREKQQRILIVGVVGSGKSMQLKYLALSCLEPKTYLREESISNKEIIQLNKLQPIFIRLKNVSSLIAQPEGSTLPSVIAAETKTSKKIPAQVFHWWLIQGNCVILLDGLDEVETEELRLKIIRWIENEASKYSDNHFIVTTRKEGYRAGSFGETVSLETCVLTKFQKEDLVYRINVIEEANLLSISANAMSLVQHNNAHIAARDLISKIENAQLDALDNLSGNPLLLTIMARVYRHKGHFPEGRANLYRFFCHAILEKLEEKIYRSSDVSQLPLRDISLNALRMLAYEMLKNSQPSGWEKSQVIEKLTTKGNLPTQTAGILLDSLNDDNSLFYGPDKYTFAHKSFMEFLASEYIASTPDLEEELLRQVEDGYWHETIKFYASLDKPVDGASHIIESCLNVPTPDTVNLAFEALQGVPHNTSKYKNNLEKLERFLDTCTKSVDKSLWQIAGKVYLSETLRQTTQIETDIYLTRRPIRMIEFEYFTELTKNYMIRPLGWLEEQCRSDNCREIAVGLGHIAVKEFIDWLNEIKPLGVSWSFRLPTIEEVQAGLSLLSTLNDGKYLIWTQDGNRINLVEIQSQDPKSRILQNYETERIINYFQYLTNENLIPVQILDNYLKSLTEPNPNELLLKNKHNFSLIESDAINHLIVTLKEFVHEFNKHISNSPADLDQLLRFNYLIKTIEEQWRINGFTEEYARYGNIQGDSIARMWYEEDIKKEVAKYLEEGALSEEKMPIDSLMKARELRDRAREYERLLSAWEVVQATLPEMENLLSVILDNLKDEQSAAVNSVINIDDLVAHISHLEALLDEAIPILRMWKAHFSDMSSLKSMLSEEMLVNVKNDVLNQFSGMVNALGEIVKSLEDAINMIGLLKKYIEVKSVNHPSNLMQLFTLKSASKEANIEFIERIINNLSSNTPREPRHYNELGQVINIWQTLKERSSGTLPIREALLITKIRRE